MSEILLEEIKSLKNDVIKMGKFAIEMLNDSIKALKTQDVNLAENVILRKSEIRHMDIEIEERALQTIALYHPVARDMRTIGAILKMITYITRVGRYAKDIAKMAKELSEEPHISRLVEIPYMAKIVEDMLQSSLKSFEEEDIYYIHGLSEKDDDVDSLYYSIFRECLTYMMEDPKNITRCSYYIMVARALERCGDHACKMAEKVYYMVTGEHMEIK